MCSEPDPLLLLRLYPSLVPEKFLLLLPSSAYGEPFPDLAAAEAAADVSSSSSGSSSMKRKGSSKPDVANAVGVVVPYLLSHRTRLLASLEEAAAVAVAAAASSNREQQQGKDAGSAGVELTNGEAAATASGSSSRQRTKQELELVATVIDTAILRAMLQQPDSGALLRLLQQMNYVDLEDGEAVLTAAGRYAELAALYQYNRLQKVLQHCYRLCGVTVKHMCA
jgi:hypothetical protein